ncbi:MAG: hypothetical protein AB1487_00305 [Thermodesulfobacteriota bacterium]
MRRKYPGGFDTGFSQDGAFPNLFHLRFKFSERLGVFKHIHVVEHEVNGLLYLSTDSLSRHPEP